MRHEGKKCHYDFRNLPYMPMYSPHLYHLQNLHLCNLIADYTRNIAFFVYLELEEADDYTADIEMLL